MVYGEAIIDRLHPNCSLRNLDNPARQIILNTVGALLDDFDLYDTLEAPFLQNASNVYLDLHGKDLNVNRRLNETDDDYRKRLFYEVLGVLTVNYLLTVYDLDLLVKVSNFSKTGLKLTSDNPYINNAGFMADADDDVKQILESKFVLEGGVEWIQ